MFSNIKAVSMRCRQTSILIRRNLFILLHPVAGYSRWRLGTRQFTQEGGDRRPNDNGCQRSRDPLAASKRRPRGSRKQRRGHQPNPILRGSMTSAKLRQPRGSLLPPQYKEPNMTTVIRLPELLKLVPISRTTLWRMERDGEFPSRIRLGANSVGWDLAEVEAWLSERPRGMTVRPTPSSATSSGEK